MKHLLGTLQAAAGVAVLQLVAASGVTAAEAPPSAGAAAPGAAALGHCAAIAAADARLACYDALAGRAATTTTVVPAPSATPAPTAAVVAAPAAASDPQNFGIAQVRVQEAPKGPAAIQAHVAQVFDNGSARASVVLDNGQKWTFAESSADASLSPGDAVTIRRAALGSFLLVTPSHHAYHVHRVQ